MIRKLFLYSRFSGGIIMVKVNVLKPTGNDVSTPEEESAGKVGSRSSTRRIS